MNPVYVTRSFDAIFAEMAKRGYSEEDVRAELIKLPFEHPSSESPDYRLTAYPASDLPGTPLANALMRFMARGTPEEEDHYHSIMLECQKTKTFQMIKEIFHILGISPFTRDVASDGDATSSSEKAPKKAFFLVSQNMQDLTAQNCERIVAELGDQVQLFVFTSQRSTSTSKVSYNPTLEDAQAYLRIYDSFGRSKISSESQGVVANPPTEDPVAGPKIPFFIFLANTQQITKMNAILCTIRSMGIGSEVDDQDLSSYVFFDEADQTYPIAREILMDHIFDTKIYRDFGVIRPLTSNGTVRRIYWISATQEEMVLTYPECGVSKQAQIEFQDGVVENHYSILDSSAIVHYNTHTKGTDHNQYLIDTIEGNREHFFIPHPNGSYRKVIGLTSVDNESQLSVVRYINELGGNVILLNQEGVFLYTRQVVTTEKVEDPVPAPEDAPTEELSAATVTDEAPTMVEEEMAMEEDGEQVIDTSEKHDDKSSITSSSSKKADLPPELQKVRSRGIELKDRAIKSRNALIAKAYHILYPELKDAPLFILGNRKVDRGLTFHYAPISSDAYSFILTDLIMGRIPSWRRAVQAIGRGNGVIKHRADFVGEIHYWVDTITFKSVVLHCKMMSDPMIIAEKAPEYPDYDAQELIEILTAKYRDPDEDADDAQKKKRGPRAKYQFDLTAPCNTYQELCKVMQAIYPGEKFRKSFTQLKASGLFVSTRLKKHFGVTKAEELTAEHICTEEMIHGPEPIDWKKVLYSSDMRYLMIPYYQLPNLEAPKWIGVMKNRAERTGSNPSSAASSEASNASDLMEDGDDSLGLVDLNALPVDAM
jgi:hypothetical protein